MTEGVEMAHPTTAFVHVEVVHPDPYRAADFLRDALGAEQVERGISGYLEAAVPGVKVVHMKLGNVVFQLVGPNADVPLLRSWHEQLRDHGPSVHNVTVFVDGLEGVRQAMLDHGAAQVAEADLGLSAAGIDVSDPQRLYVMDARQQSGLRFELLETIRSWTPGDGP